ncbi:ariadne 1 [Carabus blaptoides fortunei]
MNPDEAVPMDGIDSGNETSNSDDVDFSLDGSDQCSTREDCFDEGYVFEVLSTENIVQYMTDIIKDVVNVAELPTTTARILLNYFNWDKDRLMEEMFDGDQDKLFAKAKEEWNAKYVL